MLYCCFFLHPLLFSEFVKLNSVLKLDIILSKFLIDYSIYKGRYDDALMRVQQETNRSLIRDIRAASLFYIKKSFGVCDKLIIRIIKIYNLQRACRK